MNKDPETKISLFCVNCDEEVMHSVHYIGNSLRSIQCEKCGRKIEIDRRRLTTVFAEDFLNKILEKPHKISEDMKEAFILMTPFIPKRIFREPLKVMKEIVEVLKKKDNEEH